MSYLIVDPVLVQKAQKAVDEAKILYSDAKANYLELLEEKSHWEEKFEKEKGVGYLSIYVDDQYIAHLLPDDKNKLPCICHGAHEQICKGFQVVMDSLQPNIELAFQKQHEAAQQLLDAKRRLSDTQNGYPIDYNDANYN
jgi:hypothetical protein